MHTFAVSLSLPLCFCHLLCRCFGVLWTAMCAHYCSTVLATLIHLHAVAVTYIHIYKFTIYTYLHAYNYNITTSKAPKRMSGTHFASALHTYIHLPPSATFHKHIHTYFRKQRRFAHRHNGWRCLPLCVSVCHSMNGCLYVCMYVCHARLSCMCVDLWWHILLLSGSTTSMYLPPAWSAEVFISFSTPFATLKPIQTHTYRYTASSSSFTAEFCAMPLLSPCHF